MKYFINTAGLALLLLSANVFATDTTTSEDLEAQAAKGNAIALAKLKTGAESGNAAYEAAYGGYFATGIWGVLNKTFHMGIPQDVMDKNNIQAFFWYKKAADQGNAIGEMGVAYMYEEGFGGVKKDLNQALEWYTKAAIQGGGDEEAALGRFYTEKLNNDKQAVVWYTKAADQGVKGDDVYIYLGDMYVFNRGVDNTPKENQIIAYALYDLAGDYQDLGGYYSDLHLSKTEIKRAKALKQRMSQIGVSAAIAEYLKSIPKSKNHTNRSKYIP